MAILPENDKPQNVDQAHVDMMVRVAMADYMESPCPYCGKEWKSVDEMIEAQAVILGKRVCAHQKCWKENQDRLAFAERYKDDAPPRPDIEVIERAQAEAGHRSNQWTTTTYSGGLSFTGPLTIIIKDAIDINYGEPIKALEGVTSKLYVVMLHNNALAMIDYIRWLEKERARLLG